MARLVDQFDGECAVCGRRGVFFFDQNPTRESYLCPECGASLRYQGQARAIVNRYSRGARTLGELVKEPDFRTLRIWEPGELGPFRPLFGHLTLYTQSAFWPDVAPGETRNGLRCEDLTSTTFPDASFDLIVTSDIFEHVRKPDLGFGEIHRILKPDGWHIFSIPTTQPIPAVTTPRVDVVGDDGSEDVQLLEARYHRGHLVYNDFGADMVMQLAAMGLPTTAEQFVSPSDNASRLLTFCSQKQASPEPNSPQQSSAKETAPGAVARQVRRLGARVST